MIPEPTKQRTGVVVACIGLLGLFSCVNEQYDIEKLNTEVTIGQEGLELPVGSTDKLKLSSFLKDMNQDILSQINGAYALKVSDKADFSKNIPDISNMINIKDISINETFVYNMDHLSAEGMVIDGIDFNTKFDVINGLNTNVSVPQISNNTRINLGLHDYVSRIKNVDLSKTLSSHQLSTKASFAIPQIPPTVTDELPLDNITQNVDRRETQIAMSVNSPDKDITAISDIQLDDRAKMSVKVELIGHEFLTKGDITPEIKLEYGNLFGLVNNAGTNLSSSITITKVLNKANNFTTTDEYKLKSLNIKASDWVNGSLNITQPMCATGTITISNGATSAAALNNYKGNGTIEAKITITFSGVTIKSATFDLNEITINKQMQVPVSLGNGIALPEQVNSIDDIVFTSGSNISMAMNSENLNIPGLNANMKSMTLKFPTSMTMTGAANGIFNLGSIDLKNSTTKQFHIERIDFPKASSMSGMLKWDEIIDVNTVVSFSGKGINTVNLPASAASDAVINTNTSGSLNIHDWHATINPIENKINPIKKVFKQDLYGKISEFGTFIVNPLLNPVITITIPSTYVALKAGTEGVRLSLPKFVTFKNLSPELNYNTVDNSITLKGVIPEKIELPINKLIITPEPKEGGVGHEITGEFRLEGSVRVDQDQVSGKDMENLKLNGVTVNASVPKMYPSSVEIDEFKIDVNNEIKTTLLKGSDIPAELLSMTEAKLDNVSASMEVTLTDVPSLGAGKELYADFIITLPEEIVLDQTDNRINGNNITVKGPIKNNKFIVAPIKINELNLKGYDFTKKDDIVKSIKIAGKLSVSKPDIDVTNKFKPVQANIAASISKIKFSKVQGKLDYKLQPTNQTITLSEIPDILKGDNVCLDIDNPYLLLKLKTNLGIPMKGHLVVTPVRNGADDTNGTFELGIDVKAAPDATQKDSTMLFIAAKNEGCPSDYQFVECQAIKSLIRQIPDGLKLTFDASTSTSQDCIMEPNAKYMLEADYSLVAPMAFGKDLNVELTDTLTNLGDAFPKYLKGNMVKLVGNITNSLPLELDLDVDMIGNNNQIIKFAGPARQKVKACASDGSASTVPLDITIKVDKDADLSDFKGLLFRFKVTSGNVTGIPVTDECFVQANVKAKFPYGISTDLKDFSNTANQPK